MSFEKDRFYIRDFFASLQEVWDPNNCSLLVAAKGRHWEDVPPFALFPSEAISLSLLFPAADSG
jgi:hypothetical protein